jgi:putative transposase
MQLTESFYLKNNKNNSFIFNQLIEWTKISKNLYNQALYLIKNNYEENKDKENYKALNYYDLDKIMKKIENLEGNINYRLMPSAQCSQQILKLLEQNIKSFYKSLKDYKKNPFKYKEKPKFPKFLKNNKYILIFTNQRVKIKNNELQLLKNFKLKLPKNVIIKDLNCIRIIPKSRNIFKIEIVYNIQEKELKKDNSHYLGIDLGLNNFVTCVSNLKLKPLIFDGRVLKSYNKWYNKRKAFLQSRLKNKQYNSKRLEDLEFKRYCKITDILHLYSARIVQYCLQNNINTIVIGRNKNWKQKINIGKINNQKFVQIPYLKFINMLKYKCKLYGINFIETEESYTSKVDHLAKESIEHHDSYLGKRVRRGLFQSSTNKLINADVNGSIGILRKVVGDSIINQIINSGCLYNPIRLNCYRIKKVRFLII